MKKEYDLLNGNIFKIFKNFFITSVMGMLMISLYILFDTIFIGQGVGKEGLAALNISIPIYNFVFGTGVLVGVGSATVMSMSLGEKDIEGAQRGFDHSIILGLVFGLVYTLFGLFFIDTIIQFLGASPYNIGLIKQYLGIIIPFSWSFLMVNNLSVIVRNDNGPKRVMIAMVVSGITNVIFDYIFIFPLQMGMRGAAIATVMSNLISLTILIWHFVGGHSRFNIKSIRLQVKLVYRIIMIGMSSFIVELSSGIVIFLFNRELIKTLGDIGVSAYSIIANVALMVVAIFTGIAQGIQPIVSINFGAKKLERVYKIRKYGLISSIALGLIFMGIGLIMPGVIISTFTRETGKIVDITKEGIRIYFLAFPLIGINIVMTGFFQSIGQARYSTFLSLLRGIIFTFLGLKILIAMFGTIGIWMTAPIVELFTLLSIIIIFLVSKKSGGFYNL